MSKESNILSISDLTIVEQKHGIAPFSIRDNVNRRNRAGFLVKNMNLFVKKNQIHGIVGESGSGKSLTMKSILGLIDFSPGIISGKIEYIDNKKRIDLLPHFMQRSIVSGWISRFLKLMNKENLIYRTEYHIVNPENPAVELRYVPKADSINVFIIDQDKHCIQTDFIPPTKLNQQLVRLKQAPKYDQIVAVSYSQTSNYSSYHLKNSLEKFHHNQQLRGKRISMILQDPQTFLNPHWSIEKQVKNIIKMQRTKGIGSLYVERNFILRIIGSKKDFPICLKWDKEKFNRYLRQADIRIDSKQYSMLSSEQIHVKKGSLHYWGFKLVGRKYFLLIHPGEHKDQVRIKWNKGNLSLKVIEASLSIKYHEGVKNTNMLSQDSLLIEPDLTNEEGIISVGLDLVVKSGNDFKCELEVTHGPDYCKLVYGIEQGATEGLDVSKGEKQIETPLNKFFAGFQIDTEDNNSYVLSHRDIRSPIDIMTTEAVLTVIPRYDQDYVGGISILSSLNKGRYVEFGLLSSATEGEDEHLGEKDTGPKLNEGVFGAGFIIGGKEGEIFSPKDLRSLRPEMDLNAEVSSLLSKVNLNDVDVQFRKQYPHEISGGQGQRVMISLAMAAKPDVLIADEPTTGLDVTNQTEVVQMFRQYKDQGRTIILISHDLNFVSHLADYYTIIYAGTDMEHMKSDILDSNELLHPYTKRLLDIARDEEREGFNFIEKEAPDPYRNDLSGCPFESRCLEKDKIEISNGKHLCKSLFPPMVNVESGVVVEKDQMKDNEHYARCWLFLKI